MTRQVIVPAQRRRRVGEIAGGTAAECAAVSCCCPCAVMHFVVLAVYTVPKELVKKAVQKRRKRRRLLKDRKSTNRNDVMPWKQRGATDNVVFVGPTTLEEYLAKDPVEIENASDKWEAVQLDNEMWARFTGTGFWRSESRRQP